MVFALRRSNCGAGVGFFGSVYRRSANDVSEIVSTVGLRPPLAKRDNLLDVIDLGQRSMAAQAAGVGI